MISQRIKIQLFICAIALLIQVVLSILDYVFIGFLIAGIMIILVTIITLYNIERDSKYLLGRISKPKRTGGEK
jgi:hypothetical protein